MDVPMRSGVRTWAASGNITIGGRRGKEGKKRKGKERKATSGEEGRDINERLSQVNDEGA